MEEQQQTITDTEQREPSNSQLTRIASGLGCALGYLERRSITGLLEDLRQVMLRSPERAIGSVILLGFVLGASLRSRR